MNNDNEESANSVELSEVCFHYHLQGQEAEQVGIRDVTFTVPAGSVTVLCGASGSGKSTVLRTLNGLVPHFHPGLLSGTALVDGLDAPRAGINQAGQKSATVFQNPRSQFFTSDVTSELAFRGENYGIDPEVISVQVAQAAQATGITALMGRPLTKLSGGELQKVACACAVAAGTPVVLFDEPTSNLSAEAIDDFAKIVEVLKKQGKTVIIAEHRLYFLRDLADQVLLFENGELESRFDAPLFFSMAEPERKNRGLRALAKPQWRTEKNLLSQGVPAPDDDDHESGLYIERLTFSYGSKPVLDLEKLSFPAGKVTALVGENGAGKTTLARVLTGLEKPSRNSKILWDGHPVSAAKRLSLSYIVMQDVHRQLFSETVTQEVTLGVPQDQDHPLDTRKILQDFDLDHLEDRHPLSLSGGQKQRLVVASAIASDKSIYVFDEPTSGVDYRHLISIGKQMRALAERGCVVIVITHDQELLVECADRVVELCPLTRTLVPGGHPQTKSQTTTHLPHNAHTAAKRTTCSND